MKILLAAGGNPENWPQPLLTKYDAYVGIDRGALYLLQAGYPVDLFGFCKYFLLLFVRQ